MKQREESDFELKDIIADIQLDCSKPDEHEHLFGGACCGAQHTDDATVDDKNSFEEGMAMLSENQEHDYSVLEKEQSDYSVLDKVGDGLMIAAKLASTLVGARVFSF